MRRGEQVQRVGAWLRGAQGQGSLGRRLAEVRALERWTELVGPHLAGRTRVMQLSGDQLFVIANGSALRQELTYHQDVILRKFNEAAGRRVARRIRFLESDAQLSSLLGSEETGRVPPARPAEAAVGDVTREEPGEAVFPAGPAYERFDAESYRRELTRRG